MYGTCRSGISRMGNGFELCNELACDMGQSDRKSTKPVHYLEEKAVDEYGLHQQTYEIGRASCRERV